MLGNVLVKSADIFMDLEDSEALQLYLTGQKLANDIETELPGKVSFRIRPLLKVKRLLKTANGELPAAGAGWTCGVELPSFCLNMSNYGPNNRVDEILKLAALESELYMADQKDHFEFMSHFLPACYANSSVTAKNLFACALREVVNPNTHTNYSFSLASNTINRQVQDGLLQANAYASERRGYDAGRAGSKLVFNEQPLVGFVSPLNFVHLLCSGIDPQPLACSAPSVVGLVAQVQQLFDNDNGFEYANSAVFCTLGLCIIFVLYTVGLLLMQCIFPNHRYPPYVPLAVTR